MSSFGAILDANGLITAGPRDTLLRAAAEGLYRLYWSEEILDEVRRNLIDLLTAKGKPSPMAAADRLIDTIREEFPEALVEGYEDLVPAMTNDEKDRHVLAAAVVAQAQAIVTQNLRDFPDEALRPYSVEAQSPDTFLADVFDLYPERMVRILTEQGADRRERYTLGQVIASLENQLPHFAAAVRAFCA